MAFVTAWIFTLALPGLLFILDAGGSPGSAAEVVPDEAPAVVEDDRITGAERPLAKSSEPASLEVYGTRNSAPLVLEQRPESGAVSSYGSSVEVISALPSSSPETRPSMRASISGREAVPTALERETVIATGIATGIATTRSAVATAPQALAPDRASADQATSKLSHASDTRDDEARKSEAREVVVTSAPPVWQQNAALAPMADDRPVIALVLDDLGLNRSGTKAAIELEAPLTLAFMSYAERLSPLLDRARRRGHELMMHLPMEPLGAADDPGPNALMVSHAPWEIRDFLEWGLDRVPGIVGVNNHMGSRFTAEPTAMASVMEVLRERGLFYLDSRTTASDVGALSAAKVGVPFLSRDIFLDHGEFDSQTVLEQLERLEHIAHTRGHAIGIGHPHEATLAAIEFWQEGLAARGVVLVPVTEILRRSLRMRDDGPLPDQG
jgi:polysaccharide deacetylase 2 family uncharacterized protein YibQ